MPGVNFQALIATLKAAGEQTVTWNPSDKNSNVALSNNDLTAGSNSATFGSVRATLGRSSGKYYFEILVTQAGSTRTGIGDGTFALNNYVGNASKSAGVVSGGNTNTGYTHTNAGTFTITNGDYLMFAVDMDADKAWVGKNNVWQLSGDPAAGTNPWLDAVSGTVYPATSVYETNCSFTLRTKTSEIAGSVPSGFSVWAANS